MSGIPLFLLFLSNLQRGTADIAACFGRLMFTIFDIFNGGRRDDPGKT
jgi:hypothetical protein